VSDCCLTLIWHDISWREQVNFQWDDDEVRFVAHWNDNPQIDTSLHSDTLSRFRDNQSLPFLLFAACLAEKQTNAIFIVFGLTRLGFEPMIYWTGVKYLWHWNENKNSKILWTTYRHKTAYKLLSTNEKAQK
jgi:hypothetical protein